MKAFQQLQDQFLTIHRLEAASVFSTVDQITVSLPHMSVTDLKVLEDDLQDLLFEIQATLKAKGAA